MSNPRWFEQERLRVVGVCLALGSACGGEAAGAGQDEAGESSRRVSALRGGALVAEVEAIGEDAALERSGHGVAAVGRRLFVVRGVRDDFETQTNTFPEDVLRLGARSGRVRALAERGEGPGGLAHSCLAADEPGGSLYLFGGGNYLFELDPGFFESLLVSDALFRFDVAARRWARLEPSGERPSARNGCAAHVFEGKLYVFAGISGSFEVNDEVWRFDPELASWSRLEPSGPVPPARYKPITALDESAGKIYFYGGLAFGAAGFARLDDFWEYDLASNTFRELPSGITPVRDQGALAVLRGPRGGRYVVHVGGDVPSAVSCVGFPQLAAATDEVWAFDVAAETWALLPTEGAMPRVEYHAGASVGRDFVFAGGWAEEPDPARVCRQEWNPYIYRLSLGRR